MAAVPQRPISFEKVILPTKICPTGKLRTEDKHLRALFGVDGPKTSPLPKSARQQACHDSAVSVLRYAGREQARSAALQIAIRLWPTGEPTLHGQGPEIYQNGPLLAITAGSRSKSLARTLHKTFYFRPAIDGRTAVGKKLKGGMRFSALEPAPGTPPPVAMSLRGRLGCDTQRALSVLCDSLGHFDEGGYPDSMFQFRGAKVIVGLGTEMGQANSPPQLQLVFATYSSLGIQFGEIPSTAARSGDIATVSACITNPTPAPAHLMAYARARLGVGPGMRTVAYGHSLQAVIEMKPKTTLYGREKEGRIVLLQTQSPGTRARIAAFAPAAH